MNMHRLALSVVSVFLVSGSAAAGSAQVIDPKNPPQGLFSDEWTDVMMMGGKVGYGHSTMTRQGDRILTATHMKLKLARANVSVSIEMNQSTVETVAGDALEFETVMIMADTPVRSRGVFKDGAVTITTTQFGMDSTKTYPLPEVDGKPVRPMMIWGLYRETAERGFAPGTSYTLTTYSPDIRLDGVVEIVTRVGGDETFEHRGQKLTARRIDADVVTPMGRVTSVSWIDPATTKMVKTQTNLGGISMDMIVVPQAEAVKDFVPAEFFMTNTVPVTKRIPYKEARQATYRLSPKDGAAFTLELPETAMQKIEGRDGSALTVRLARVDHAALRKAEAKPLPGDSGEFLESNVLINTTDPKLIELASQAAGDEKDPLALADRLRRFVSDYIDAKSLDVGFATASDVCRSKKGDCSEHAVLLAALGRIRGLPSRVAVGLAYVPIFGGQQDIFGFHMWTQFWVNGAWVDFDAALNESDCSPTRIAFALSSMRETALAELSFKMMDVIGRIDLDVVSVETGATPVKP